MHEEPTALKLIKLSKFRDEYERYITLSKTKSYLRSVKLSFNQLIEFTGDIAMVFQNYALYPHMTSFENIAFGLKIRKFPKEEIKERVDYAAGILGIEDLLDRKPKELSGGQRQRVAVGRAIVRKPKVFLFDEPLSNLDAKLRVQMRTEISRLHNKLETTMIYVTHDQTEAMTMGDRIVIMKDGVIDQINTPINIYNNPDNKFVAGFIGSPAMNFINGRIVKNNDLTFVSNNGSTSIPLRMSDISYLKDFVDQNIILGIRPEDIYFNQNQVEDTWPKIEVKIEVLEPMGNEVFVYFTLDSESFIARLHSSFNEQVGKTIELYLDSNKIHFFDVASQACIS